MGCGASTSADNFAALAAGAASSTGGVGLGRAGEAGAGLAEQAAAVADAAPGELLLGVAQHLPFVAPVAFLIGAVISAAHSAKTLKADAAEFAAFVASLEALCQEAAAQGSLAKAQTAIEALREALEEGLAHCQRLQVQTFVAGMLFSGSDARKFEDIHTKIKRCMEMLSTVASVSTNAMVACKFEQGKQLASKLEELGGADKVVRDPALREQAQQFLESSDKILLAATAGAWDTRASPRPAQTATHTQSDRFWRAWAARQEALWQR